MMWHHMDATGEEEYLMAHGDCPVEIGEKITATLRLREHGQYLLLSAWPDGYYDYGMLVHPDLKFLRMTKAMRILSLSCVLFLICRPVMSGEEVPWNDDYVRWCLYPHSDELEDYFCVNYVWNYVRVNVEILSFEPVILVYRDFLPRKKVDAFLADIKEKRKDEPKRVFPTDGSPLKFYPAETTMQHNEGRGATQVYEQISALIPAIDFTVSEPWQILSYESGDDHPPRYDFIETEKDKKDEMTKKYGNRFATVMVMLKKADSAGLTIFPTSNTTVDLEEGDAILWTNMNGEGTKSLGALHGDCVVWEGTKVTASLRVRAKGQFLIKTSMVAGIYHVVAVARPRLVLLKDLKEHRASLS
ncbi:hypothetical protein ANCCAN_07671 [Ancylostoma caninum]|uniref:Prolyl 4-hydroxylase alpha subunit domain-containing protein n=1 Tax=Ancylostoma caninum TaxID=29170 RepID=A0A368GPH4_ANCCA|nr:hypothetical protein ANCCAN_07671 [Ancylostoma caninum]